MKIIKNISNIRLEFFVKKNDQDIKVVLESKQQILCDNDSITKSMILYERKNLITIEPAVAEPAVAEPAVAEPAVAEPAVAEPAVAEKKEREYKGKKRGRKKKRGPKPGLKKKKAKELKKNSKLLHYSQIVFSGQTDDFKTLSGKD